MSNNTNFKNFLNLLSFISIVAIAISLLISIAPSLSSALNLVASCIAYFVLAIFAFYYIYAKKNVALTVTYFISIIVIIVLLIVQHVP